MYFKEKSIEEWQSILNGLKSISTEVSKSEEYVGDQKFLGDSITSLESILEGNANSIRNIERVSNLLSQHYYNSIKSQLELLKGIKCFNLAELSKKIGEIGEKYALTGIALYSKDDKDCKEKRAFINRGGYKRCFFTNCNYNEEHVNLLSNGEDSICINYVYGNFIEDARRFDWNNSDYNYRLLWTTDFDFSKDNLPSKSTLDEVDFELESKKQFAKILESLKFYREQGRVQIILSNPNQIFECQESSCNDWDHTLEGTYFNTIRADGIILDNKKTVFWPTTNISIINPYLQVKDSNYVVLATNSAKQVEEETKYSTEFVSVIVNPDWFYSFVDYAIKNDSVDAKTVMDFSSCIVAETKEPITANYKVEIKPTMVKTLNLFKRTNLEQ